MADPRDFIINYKHVLHKIIMPAGWSLPNKNYQNVVTFRDGEKHLYKSPLNVNPPVRQGPLAIYSLLLMLNKLCIKALRCDV